MVVLCYGVLGAEYYAVVVGVAVGVFDFGFPGVFEFSYGFL